MAEGLIADEAESTVSPDGRIVSVIRQSYRIRGGNVSAALIGLGLDVQPFDPFDDFPFATLRKAKVKREMTRGQQTHFIVDYEWSTETPDVQQSSGGNGNGSDPTSKPPKGSFSTRKVTRIYTHDRDGNPILNSAGMPYDPPLQGEFSHFIYKIERAEIAFTDATAAAYVDKLNSSMFLGRPKGFVKCNDITASSESADGMTYWNVSYEFEYAPEGWQPEVLEAGLMELVGEGEEKTRQRIKDDEGEDVVEPWPLDDDGQKLEAGEDVIYTEWETHEEANFNGLGLT